MSKQSAGALLGLFELAPEGGEALYRQIYRSLRRAILAGELSRGTRLPSTRMLAGELGVSRNTVINAFAQLQAEGYLESGPGAGSFVARELPDSLLHPRLRRQDTPHGAMPEQPPLSARGYAMLGARTPSAPAGAPPAFTPGIPALDLFPYRQWNRSVTRSLHLTRAAELNYGSSAGYAPLREAIAAYAGAARGVRCDAGQVIMVSGVQQGLDLITRLLTDPGAPVWLEDPGHLGARGVFMAAQTHPVPVPVDAEGFDIHEALRRAPNARLAYVTPSHQSPTGVVMSLRRRLELLEWAARDGGWVIEDDYDSEFRYTGRPLAALQGLGDHSRVLYLGTFSKVLAPGLRLAYLIVPDALVDPFVAGRRLLDTHSPAPLQVAMADFIDRGYFAAHIRRMRSLYARRQAVLVHAVQRHLGSLLRIGPAASGMHLVAELHAGDDEPLSQTAAEHGLNVPALSLYYLGEPRRRGLLFGYACVPEPAIDAAVCRLGALFRPGPQ